MSQAAVRIPKDCLTVLLYSTFGNEKRALIITNNKTYTRFFMPSNSFHRKVIVYWKLIAFSDPAVSAI